MTDDAHAQANADQVRLLREALAVNLPLVPETAGPEDATAAPELPVAVTEAPP